MLKSNYVDSQYTQKKYKVTSYGSGIVSFQDTTNYTVEGDYYGAEDINLQNYTYNTLYPKYAVIDELIQVLQNEKGITVADKSPDSILTALQTDRANYFSTGRGEGQFQVITAPGNFGLVSGSNFDSAKATNTSYKSKIANATGILSTNLPYTPYGPQPPMPTISDPITAAQANTLKNTYRGWLDGVLEAFSAFYSTASSVLSNASNALGL